MILGKKSRQALARSAILEAAWTVARSAGLASFTLTDVAKAVGTKAPSLYSYFPSKHAIYDAMFHQGNVELLVRMQQIAPADNPKRVLLHAATLFLDFCAEDPVRHQLLFQSPLPGFQPSPEAYAPARDLHAFLGGTLASLGIIRPGHVDLWSALLSGLAAQQLANDPGGSRWTSIVQEAVDMYSGHVLGPTP